MISEKKNVKCKKCGKEYNNKRSLGQHLRFHNKKEREKASLRQLGKNNSNYGNHTSKNKGKNNPNFKPNSIKFSTIHMFIGKRKEKPDKCERCKKENCRIELSFNHDLGDYTRNPNDYEYLCCKCHKQRDMQEFGVKFGRKSIKFKNTKKSEKKCKKLKKLKK